MIHCPKCQTPFDPKTKWGLKKFCSYKCSNSRPRTEELNQLAREYAKAHPKGWAANPSNERGTKAMRDKWTSLRQTLICKECQKEFEVPYSKRARTYCSVSCSNKNKYHENSNKKKASFYNGCRMDSGADLIFAKLLDEHHIIWSKNTSVFFLFAYPNGKVGKYYPDFFLPDYDQWIEIKGKRYYREDDPLRWAACPGLEVIWSTDINLPSVLAAPPSADLGPSA